MHFRIFTNMLPWIGKILYINFPDMNITIETAINIAGNPKPNGKQSSIPMHFTSSLRIGVTSVEMKDPKLIGK